MKKLISMVVCVSLLLTCFPVSAFSEANENDVRKQIDTVIDTEKIDEESINVIEKDVAYLDELNIGIEYLNDVELRGEKRIYSYTLTNTLDSQIEVLSQTEGTTLKNTGR